MKGHVELEQISIEAQGRFLSEYRADMLGGVSSIKITANAIAKSNQTMIGQSYDVTESSSAR